MAVENIASEQIKEELEREQKKEYILFSCRRTIFWLLVVASCTVLIIILFIPVMRIRENSMAPALHEGDIVVSVKNHTLQPGDIIGFHYGNNVLIKRYIAGPGQWVKIDDDGNVYVDDILMEEPYIQEKSLGNCNIEFPCQVPDNRVFVLGDYRATSLDSRHVSIGFIEKEEIIGKIVFRLWPIQRLGNLQ